MEAIVQANSLANPHQIYAGQRLTIPAQDPAQPQGATAYYTVQWGDTLYSIASRLRMTADVLAALNGLSNPNFIWTGQVLRTSPPSSPAQEPSPSLIHVVQRGEILLQIAHKYNTTVWALAAANNLSNPSFIYAGQRLIIPTGGGGSPSILPGGEEKWIDINLTAQTLVAYEGDGLVYSAIVSTGTAAHPTVTGRYRIQRKYLYDDMTGGSQATGDYYYLPDVPHVMYFYSGYAIHGTYWHSNFGTPMSFGCVNLNLTDAQWLFNWASPTLPPGSSAVYSSPTDPGTLVVIHY
jgi:LysM repeat protein